MNEFLLLYLCLPLNAQHISGTQPAIFFFGNIGPFIYGRAAGAWGWPFTSMYSWS